MSDDELARALRLLADNPGLIEAAMKLAKVPANVVKPPVPSVRQLWADWWPFARTTPSIKIYESQGAIALELSLVLPGGFTCIGDLPWDQCTPIVGDIYRAAREKMTNRRKGRNGAPGTISPTTVNRELGTLQTMLSYHRRNRTIPHNPLAGVRRVDEDPYARQTFLTREEFDVYIKHGPAIFQDIMTTSFRCVGMRPTEARLLEKLEIHWPTLTIRLRPLRTKNKKTAPIPIPEDVVPILQRNVSLSLGPLVFVSPLDPARLKPVPYGTFNGMAQRARLYSGVQGVGGELVVPHSAGRHSGITNAIADGADASDVARVARVSERVMKKTYHHWEQRQEDRLRAVLNGQRKDAKPSTPYMDRETKVG